MAKDIALFNILTNNLMSVAREMSADFLRSAYSVVIREAARLFYLPGGRERPDFGPASGSAFAHEFGKPGAYRGAEQDRRHQPD